MAIQYKHMPYINRPERNENDMDICLLRKQEKVLIHSMESLMNEFEWGWIIEPTKLI